MRDNDMGEMMKIAVFASGSGSNFQAIAESINAGKIPGAEIALLVCDKPGARVLERAKVLGIESVLIEIKDYQSKTEYEKAIIKELKKRDAELIVLAGYMKLVGHKLLDEYKNRILNIHPALLPSFKGTDGIKDALEYGAKTTGPTVHFVDEEVDHGPIIMQAAVEITEGDTQDTLAAKIHEAEHRIYPEAIRLFVEGKLKIKGRKVRILS